VSRTFKDKKGNLSYIFINLYELVTIFTKCKTVSYKDGNITEQAFEI